MKLSGFVWGGAAIVAAISGWAFWLEGVDELTDSSDRVVERVDQRIDRTTARIDRTVDRIDDRIDRINRAVDHAVDRPNPSFVRELERLEPAITAGDMSRGDAIDQAIAASIERSTGPGTGTEPAEEAEAATAIFSEARAELDAAERDVRQARENDELSAEQYSDALAAITRAQVRIEEAERAATAERIGADAD